MLQKEGHAVTVASDGAQVPGAPRPAPPRPLTPLPPLVPQAVERFREAVEALPAGDGAGPRRAFDVIFMDCLMPAMTGYEATGAIRALEAERGLARHLIVALTAKAAAEDEAECRAAGMDGFLPKPVRRPMLSALIEEYLAASEPAAAAQREPEGELAGTPQPEAAPARLEEGGAPLREEQGGEGRPSLLLEAPRRSSARSSARSAAGLSAHGRISLYSTGTAGSDEREGDGESPGRGRSGSPPASPAPSTRPPPARVARGGTRAWGWRITWRRGPGRARGRPGRAAASRSGSPSAASSLRGEGGAGGDEGAPPGPRDVLVADDVEVNRRVLCALLAREGFRCLPARDGQEAVDAFRRRCAALAPGAPAGPVFAAVFMDVSMPVLDGYAATRQIRHLERAHGVAAPTPVIACTALSTSKDREEMRSAGMDDWVVKPVARPRLAHVLAKHLAPGPGPRPGPRPRLGLLRGWRRGARAGTPTGSRPGSFRITGAGTPAQSLPCSPAGPLHAHPAFFAD
eukprot:tig00000498_g1651.t1